MLNLCRFTVYSTQAVSHFHVFPAHLHCVCKCLLQVKLTDEPAGGALMGTGRDGGPLHGPMSRPPVALHFQEHFTEYVFLPKHTRQTSNQGTNLSV